MLHSKLHSFHFYLAERLSNDALGHGTWYYCRVQGWTKPQPPNACSITICTNMYFEFIFQAPKYLVYLLVLNNADYAAPSDLCNYWTYHHVSAHSCKISPRWHPHNPSQTAGMLISRLSVPIFCDAAFVKGSCVRSAHLVSENSMMPVIVLMRRQSMRCAHNFPQRSG